MTIDDVIRRALDAEAATVDVRPDALATIRARTGRRRARFAVKAWIGGGLAVAAAAATAAVFVLDAPPPAPPAPPATTTEPPASPERLLAVYYVGPDRGDRLVREFHRAAPATGAAADQVRAALGLMFAGVPADPDYASAWPAGVAVRGVTVTGDVATVDLGGATPPTPIAAQQLVWTVTAVSGLKGVRIGSGSVLHRAAAVETLAPVWLINPQHGDVVRTLKVHVAGFAGRCRLVIRTSAGRVVSDEQLTLSGGSPAQREAQLTAVVAPGDYVLTVTVDGGVDDHVVRVE
ncbi:sporulation and spore germination protein [Asanoa ferruginea]|uniref:Sporulation and spore germination protein n=1 Tax=Asanoa ferruginea TaxID=53367 RepID=A0A3D9ZS32_9ACTN|nr:GerMN domain-containing protein [Asanoa ferruginea]REF98793.1 sporulation and spore germination protein [Asanoa ferruginea]GIF49535.1 hypothetical protein Afe04nite_40740 [Asanoa ferruginea]